MDIQMSNVIQQEQNQSTNFLQKIWHSLVEPPEEIQSPLLRRKMRLLSKIILTIFIFFIPFDILNLVINPTVLILKPVWTGALLLIIAFILIRRNHYTIAMWCVSLSFSVVTFSLIVVNQFDHPELLLLFLLVGLLISSIFHSIRAIVTLTCINIICILFLPNFNPSMIGLELLIFPIALLTIATIVIIITTQHRIEDEKVRQDSLRSANELLQTTQTVAQMGSWTFDLATQRVSWSPEMYTLFDRDLKLGPPTLDNFLENVHPQDKIIIDSLQNNTLQYEKPVGADFRVFQPDNTLKYYHVRSFYLHQPHKNESKLIGTVQDITNRKQSEEELKNKAVLLKSISDAVIVTDMNFFIQSWNKAAEKLYGWKEAEVLGKNVGSIIKTTYPNASGEDVLTSFSLNGSWQGEAIQRDKNGEIIYVIGSVNKVYSDNEAFSIMAINRDITEFKIAEKALQASESRFRALYNNSPTMMHSINEKGILINVNNYWLETMGYAQEDVIGQPMSQFLAEHSRRYANEVGIARLFERGHVKDVAYQFVKKSGDVIDILLSGIVEQNDKDAPLSTMEVLIDVTEQKRAEAQVQRYANQFKALHEIDQILLKGTSLEAIATAAFTHIQSILPYQHLMISTINAEESTLQILALTGVPITGIVKGAVWQLTPKLTEFIKSKKPYLMVEDISVLASPTMLEEMIVAGGLHSYISFPLFEQERVAGFFSIVRTTIGAFLEDEIKIGRRIANTLSVGFHQMTLNEALRTSEEKLRTMFQNSYDEIMVVDEAFCVQFVNRLPQYAKASDLIGKCWLDYLPTEAAQKLESALAHTFLEKRPFSCEIQVDGKWYLNRIALIERDGSEKTAVINTTDITESRQAEEEIKSRNRQLAFINEITLATLQTPNLDTMLHVLATRLGEMLLADHCFITLWDEQLQIPKPAVAYGANESSFSTMTSAPNQPTFTEKILEANQVIIVNKINKQPYLNNPIFEEFRNQTLMGIPLIADGQKLGAIIVSFDNEHNYTAVEVSIGEQIAAQCAMAISKAKLFEQIQAQAAELEQRVVQRTSELKDRVIEVEQLNRGMLNLLQDLHAANHQLELTTQKLASANEELEGFSYSVSHDLRAPLRHISGFIKLLQRREQNNIDPTSSRYLDNIVNSAEKMGQLIDDLLAFSRTNRTELKMNPVDSNALIKSVQEELLLEYKEKNIIWEIPALPLIHGDNNLLRLVWVNLIANALKYSEPRDQIKIKIGTLAKPKINIDGSAKLVNLQPNEVCFYIQDNGVGFNPQYTHKLFGVFQRLHRSDEFEGNGIGLATVRRIVHRHQGQVWAEGHIDAGATFYFTLQTLNNRNL